MIRFERNAKSNGWKANTDSLLGRAVKDYLTAWKLLALTDVAFKVVAFVVLTPLSGLLFRGLLAVSGTPTLSDLDILFFFLGPYGWFCLIVIGAISLAIVALEQASLTAIAYMQDREQRAGSIVALRFAAAKAWSVIQVTARMVTVTLLATAPFAAIAMAVYFSLLTEFDINYYLKEKPPIFNAAVVIGAGIGVLLIALLCRLFTSWFFALPLVLYEDVKPREALRLSSQRMRGYRRKVLLWIVVWFLATTLLSAIVTAVVGLCGRLTIPATAGSLHTLTVAVGCVLSIWAVAGLAVNLFSTTTFAAILFRFYRELGCAEDRLVPICSADDASNDVGPRMTAKRILIAGAVGVLIAIAVGVFALQGVQVEDNVQIMAHRGSSAVAPENTIASIRQAIEDGADWVEIDVQETADGDVVVFHDSDFMKVANQNLKIWDATMDELQKIDIGSWFDPKFQNERVPTLAEVLDQCNGKIGVNIELKYYGHDQQLEQRVANIVEAHDMSSQVKVMSLKIEAVKKMKSLRPDWNVGLLMSVSAGNVRNIEADFLAVNAAFVHPNLINAAHESGKDVYVWTVNDGPTMSTMISRGVNGLLTDKPALARTVLEQRAEMSVAERLLLEIAGVLGTKPQLGEP